MAQNMVATAKSAGIGFILALIGLVLTIVLAVVFWLLQHYVAALLPAPWGNLILAVAALLPAPWGNLILAVAALLVIVWLLSRVGILPDLNAPIFR